MRRRGWAGKNRTDGRASDCACRRRTRGRVGVIVMLGLPPATAGAVRTDASDALGGAERRGETAWETARRANGLLLLDKPLNWSSAYAARWVGSVCGGKAGHAGTLDPAASGLLVIGCGEGTKALRYLSGVDKCYHACVRVGTRTTTDDGEGEIIETRPHPPLQANRLREVLGSFLGVSKQVPPMYSALKHRGKPLYVFARQNRVVERPPRQITVRSIELTQVDGESFCFTVRCSPGTYVRVLARQLGEALGSTAHLRALRRVAAGHFILANAVTPARIRRGRVALLPADAGLARFPGMYLSADQARRVRRGQLITCRPEQGQDDPRTKAEQRRWRAYDESKVFIGVLAEVEAGRLKPERVFHS